MPPDRFPLVVPLIYMTISTTAIDRGQDFKSGRWVSAI
jgi:hypothetical protein